MFTNGKASVCYDNFFHGDSRSPTSIPSLFHFAGQFFYHNVHCRLVHPCSTRTIAIASEDVSLQIPPLVTMIGNNCWSHVFLKIEHTPARTSLNTGCYSQTNEKSCSYGTDNSILGHTIRLMRVDSGYGGRSRFS